MLNQSLSMSSTSTSIKNLKLSLYKHISNGQKFGRFLWHLSKFKLKWVGKLVYTGWSLSIEDCLQNCFFDLYCIQFNLNAMLDGQLTDCIPFIFNYDVINFSYFSQIIKRNISDRPYEEKTTLNQPTVSSPPVSSPVGSQPHQSCLLNEGW